MNVVDCLILAGMFLGGLIIGLSITLHRATRRPRRPGRPLPPELMPERLRMPTSPPPPEPPEVSPFAPKRVREQQAAVRTPKVSRQPRMPDIEWGSPQRRKELTSWPQ